ncbi:MAG TPA: acyl-CoA dehydrogenase family protein, partial [Dehalococcoidales bacterium]|nr:acyl-CoA dehydrogenase family protein [Dehalococcoidales bacterium]
MEYFLTEQQKTLKSLARRIAEERVLPVRAELDEKEEFPAEILKELAAADLFRLFVPEKYDGLGGGALELCLVVEELSRVCSGVAVSYAATALGAYAIILHGSEEQKQKYLPRIANGAIAAFGLTEASAGSDVANIKTSAQKTPEGYVLNGTKQFITNGGEAKIYTVVAQTDKTKGPRGFSAFIIEKDTPGFTFGKKEKKLGIRCSATRELVFRNCLVPAENLIYKEGTGFIVAMHVFDNSRPGIAAQGVGVAQGALEAAVDYTRQRIQFGQPLISLPVVQYKLAEMAIQTEAARALVYASARSVDFNSKQSTEDSAMAKVFASDVAMRVTTD